MRLISVCLSILAVAASAAGAAPPQLSIPGEVDPGLSGGRWVVPINQSDLARYAHDRIDHITFHHEGFGGETAESFAARLAGRLKQTAVQRVQNIHNQHVGSGMGMIAYNYVIGVDGEVVKARPVSHAPATYTRHPGTGRIADFTGHVAVMVLGDFDHQPLTAVQRATLVRVMSEAQRAFRVPTAHILPHKDHVEHEGRFGTACPGRYLYAERFLLANMTLAASFEAELKARACYEGAVVGQFDASAQMALARLAAQDPGLGQVRFDDAGLWALLDRPNAACN